MAVTLLVEYSTDDASDASPSWTDATSYVRAFSTSRGRESERARVDAGTASILLDNRDRTFDPNANSLIRPNNRWRITESVSGEIVYLGYAQSYQMDWPSLGFDATVTVQLADEIRMLALDKLPTTDPPGDTYDDLIVYDNPSGYWPVGLDVTQGTLRAPVVGPQLTVAGGTLGGGGMTFGQGAVVGQEPTGNINTARDQYYRTDVITPGDSLDPGSLGEFTAEGWFAIDGTPSSGEQLMYGPLSNALSTWSLGLNTSRQFTATFRNSGGTQYTATSTTAAVNGGPWYHVVAAVTGGSVRIYVDGVQEAETAVTGSMGVADANQNMRVGNLGTDIGASKQRQFNNLAFYRYGLPADRVAAHYTAGTARGFARTDLPGDRIDDVLAAATSVAATDLQTGSNMMVGSYMRGQSPLEEIRKAEDAENVDAFMFIAKDGTITFLADGHRDTTPWDTVQSTFSDDGLGLEYTDLRPQYDDSFLANQIEVTPEGGTTVTAMSAASIDTNGLRPLQLTALPIISVLSEPETSIAAALLAKYQNAFFRINSLTTLLKTDAEAAEVLALELGDRIRIVRHTLPQDYLYPATDLYPSTTLYPLEGPIDQEAFVQRIEVTGTPQTPWQVRLGVSPL